MQKLIFNIISISFSDINYHFIFKPCSFKFAECYLFNIFTSNMVIFTLYIGYIDKETDKQKHQQIDKNIID